MTTGQKTFTAEYQLRQCATNCEPLWDADAADWGGPGKYEGAPNQGIVRALDTVVSNGFFDMAHGATDQPGGYQALWGRWILREDEQGFVTYEEFDFDQDAEAEFLRRFEDEPNTYTGGD